MSFKRGSLSPPITGRPWLYVSAFVTPAGISLPYQLAVQADLLRHRHLPHLIRRHHAELQALDLPQPAIRVRESKLHLCCCLEQEPRTACVTAKSPYSELRVCSARRRAGLATIRNQHWSASAAVTGQVVKNNRDFKTLRHAAAGPVRSLITTPSPPSPFAALPVACFNSRCDRATRLPVACFTPHRLPRGWGADAGGWGCDGRGGG
jgi:hypothetical protein